MLYKIARSYGLTHSDAEDEIQGAHYTAYTQLKFFRKDSSYKTWLTKILLNRCYHKVNYGNLKYENLGDLTDKTKSLPSIKTPRA